MSETSRPIRYLGIDPGLQRTGYALVERGRSRPILREGGVIRSTKEKSLAERIAEIGSGIREILEQYEPRAVVIEKVFTTPQFPKSALLLAHVRGAILFATAERGIPVVHYTPTQVKRLLTGSGKLPRSKCNMRSGRNWGWKRFSSRTTWRTLSQSPCAITTPMPACLRTT